LATARAAADELEQVTDRFRVGGERTPLLDGSLQLARGRIALAAEDWDGAASHARGALAVWIKVGAPYEAAEARLVLGMAYEHQGDRGGAKVEYEAAKAGFERLGAVLEVQRVMELLGEAAATRRTFVFTDIVDSTRLLETLGDDKWKKLLARHDELLRERIGEHGGEVIKHTGDGFFAAFDNPKAAIEAAVAIQRALDAEIVAPDVRIGVHTGSAFKTETDYGGQGVHVAARIGAAAGASEILVSSETLDGVGGSFRLSDPREQALSGVDRPVEVVSVSWR